MEKPVNNFICMELVTYENLPDLSKSENLEDVYKK